jgi:hypothetical protein
MEQITDREGVLQITTNEPKAPFSLRSMSDVGATLGVSLRSWSCPITLSVRLLDLRNGSVTVIVPRKLGSGGGSLNPTLYFRVRITTGVPTVNSALGLSYSSNTFRFLHF